MSNLSHLESNLESNDLIEAPVVSRPNSLRALKHTRIRVLLAVVAVLVAVLLSGITRSSQGTMEVGSAAMADATLTSDVMPPARDAKVFHQSLPIYHWHTTCPLADAKSIRPGKPSTPMSRSFMSRAQAEKRGMFTCVYCADLSAK